MLNLIRQLWRHAKDEKRREDEENMMDLLFWERVYACEHKHLSDTYYQSFRCATPYCSGDVVRCADCGVYISECGCQANNALDGWPWLRRNKWLAQKERQTRKQVAELAEA